MIILRKSNERGHAHHGWLVSHHTFSFADYYDPEQMGFRSLRVINEDWVQPQRGFPTHPHRDMEIITYVVEGALAHKDSMGNGSIIYPGDVQRMSAGTGVTHSEYNASDSETVHLLQIWIQPKITGVKPSYEQKRFNEAEKEGKLLLVASPDGRNGSVTINQNAFMYTTILQDEQNVEHHLAPNRGAYLHIVSGEIQLNGTNLVGGDGARIESGNIKLTTKSRGEALLFDLL